MPPKSDVWNFFTRDSSGDLSAVCTLCGSKLKTSANTSNLRDHLMRRHREKYLASKKVTNEESEENPSPADPGPSKQKQIKIDKIFESSATKVYLKNSERKKFLDSTLVEMICEDMMPFKCVNRKGLRKMFHALDPRYEIPNYKTLSSTYVPDLYREVRELLIKELQKVDFISITTDLWTSLANDSYIAVTCHFISSEWQMKSAVLKTSYMKERHTAANISNVLQATFAEYNIDEKVICIVSDNAANVINAAKLSKKKHLSCFAHTLQLVVNDAVKNSLILPIIDKSKSIVRAFKMSTVATEILRNEQSKLNKPKLKLIQEVPTRWNSLYFMIKRLLEVGDALAIAISKVETINISYFTSEEIKVLKDVVEVMGHFQEITEDISGENYVTVSLIIPLVYGLTEKLKLVQRDLNTSSGKEFASAAIANIGDRLYSYETRTLTALATMLDPRWKKRGFQSSNNADIAQVWLQRAVAFLLPQENRPSTSNQEDLLQQCEGNKNEKILDFLHRIKKEVNVPRTETVDATMIIRRYLEEGILSNENDLFKFWKSEEMREKFGPLNKVAKKYLCVPGSSVPSERVFSSAGKIITQQRTNLSPRKAEMLVFLSANMWLKETSR